jgi:hypothetical protein
MDANGERGSPEYTACDKAAFSRNSHFVCHDLLLGYIKGLLVTSANLRLFKQIST